MTTENGSAGIIKLLAAGYVATGFAMVVILAVLRNDSSLVTTDAWVHGIIVAAVSLLTLSFAVRAARGNAKAFLRLRIAAALMGVASIVIIAIPGTFPAWMKWMQALCGLLAFGILFAARRKPGLSK